MLRHGRARPQALRAPGGERAGGGAAPRHRHRVGRSAADFRPAALYT